MNGDGTVVGADLSALVLPHELPERPARMWAKNNRFGYENDRDQQEENTKNRTDRHR